jgi:thiamine-monophosphate kinase
VSGAFREFELLKGIYARNALLPREVLVPPGDDMAALAFADSTLLVAVDQVVEGRHVLATTPPRLVGRKAVLRNASDVAAMAARPIACVAAAVLPSGYGAARSEELFEGLRSTAARYGCPLIGGDLSIHADPAAPLVCSVTILAGPAWPDARIVTRRGARVGDRVVVTGALGGSLHSDGGGPHLEAEPRIEEAIELLRRLGHGLRSMIDVSDGLGRDAAHLVEHDESLAIELDASRIPTRVGADWRGALRDGEDYELLAVVDPEGSAPTTLGETPLTAIGRVVRRDPGGPRVVVLAGAERIDASDLGWEHGGGAGA